MNLHIRPLESQEDYRFITETFPFYDPHYSTTPEDIQRYDNNLEPHVLRKRLVAELEGQRVGYAVFGHNAEYFHPQKFWMNGLVHPGFTRRGIGHRLLEHVLGELKAQDAMLVDVDAKESWPQSLQFLQKRGFAERTRAWESHLNPQTFDPRPFQDAEARVLARGFSIQSYAELAGDPQRDQKYWQLEMALAADMPSTWEFTPYSFEHFRKNFLENPDFIPEAHLFAVGPDGQYVALNALWKNGENKLGNGTTGTLQAFKRRGLALALKVKNLCWARTHGHINIRTFNRSDNLPMWSINQRLGFVREPAWINFERRL